MEELFARATGGYTLYEPDLDMLKFYINIGNDEDTLYLIGQLAASYPDESLAELGFVVVWEFIERLKAEGRLAVE